MFNFKVRAESEAQLLLITERDADKRRSVEVTIGSCANKCSKIKLDTDDEFKVISESMRTVHGDQHRGFWIKWDCSSCRTKQRITVGIDGQDAGFMVWDNPEPFNFRYVGVRTPNCNGSWMLGGNIYHLNFTYTKERTFKKNFE